MLAAFLGQPEEQHSHHPDDIWADLNSVPSGAGSSIKEQLLAGWEAAGRIGPPESPQWKMEAEDRAAHQHQRGR
jgi:hypothetical protein